MSPRIKAFLIHGIVSIFISILIIGLVFFIWYPFPLAKAVGATHIFSIMLMVDVVLGPLLTLLVYKEGKKSLVFDLTVIIILQISALFYGVWTISQGRPAWIVFNADRFDAIRVNELDIRHSNKAKQEYQNPSWTFPRWVSAVSPTNIEDKNKVLFEAVFSGVDIAQRPALYHPLSFEEKRIKLKAIDLNELYKFNDKTQVKNVIQQYGEANAYLPLKANALDMTVLINKDTAEIIKIVDLRPWE